MIFTKLEEVFHHSRGSSFDCMCHRAHFLLVPTVNSSFMVNLKVNKTIAVITITMTRMAMAIMFVFMMNGDNDDDSNNDDDSQMK